MIIGEGRPKNVNDKILAREVVLEKTPDSKESLKITLQASRPGGKQVPQARPVRPASSTGQTGHPHGRPKIFNPKCSEVGIWKVNESMVQEGVVKQKLTFDQLLNKYAKAVPKDRSLKKTPRAPMHQGKPASPRG